MLKERYNKAFDRVNAAQTLIEQTKREVYEMANQKQMRRARFSAALIAAIVLTAALAGVALASGWFGSVFSAMSGRHQNGDRSDYQALEALADRSGQQGGFTFSDGSTFILRLNEYYFDGEQVIAGFTMQSNAAGHMIDRNSEEFARMQTYMPEAAPMPRYDVARRLLPDALYDAFMAEYKKEGSACAVVFDMYMGDGVSVNGEYLSPDMDDEGVFEDGTRWRYFEFERPLPEEIRSRKELTLSARVYGQRTLFYMDENGVKTDSDVKNREHFDAEWTVRRTEADIRQYRASASGSDYASEIELTVSPVNARLTIETKVSERWESAELDEYGGRDGIDFIWMWEIYADGAKLDSAIETASRYGETATFPVGSTETITLRPVYVISGEHPDEEVVIRLRK